MYGAYYVLQKYVLIMFPPWTVFRICIVVTEVCSKPCYSFRPEYLNVCPNAFCKGTVGDHQCIPIEPGKHLPCIVFCTLNLSFTRNAQNHQDFWHTNRVRQDDREIETRGTQKEVNRAVFCCNSEFHGKNQSSDNIKRLEKRRYMMASRGDRIIQCRRLW